MMTYSYILGLDLGQKNDYSALSVLKQGETAAGESTYDVIHLDRWRGRQYHETPDIVRPVFQALKQDAHKAAMEVMPPGALRGPEVRVHMPLVVDATGVGISVVDSIRAAGLDCIAVTIHGGDATTGSGSSYKVPKRELVGTLQVLLQSRRLRIAKELSHAATLEQEMQNFRAKINLQTGHDTYGAGEDWRDGNHDDMVLSVALAAWYAESHDPHGWDELDDYYRNQLR